jgi:hypothetical protein
MSEDSSDKQQIRVGGGLFANTAAVVIESFVSPLTSSAIKIGADPDIEGDQSAAGRSPAARAATRDHATVSPPPPPPPPPRPGGGFQSPPSTTTGGRPSKPIVVNPNFKLVFLTVVAITVLSGIAQIAMASAWGEHPHPNQQSTFEAFGFAWKMGIGAIVGLLGGKVI